MITFFQGWRDNFALPAAAEILGAESIPRCLGVKFATEPALTSRRCVPRDEKFSRVV